MKVHRIKSINTIALSYTEKNITVAMGSCALVTVICSYTTSCLASALSMLLYALQKLAKFGALWGERKQGVWSIVLHRQTLSKVLIFVNVNTGNEIII